MLDFTQVSQQMGAYSQEQSHYQGRHAAALEEAIHRLQTVGRHWEEARQRLAQSRTSWLLADWQEPPHQHHPLPTLPPCHTVFATDGSQIVADRHEIAPCYLINIGLIALHYGTGERPLLATRPHFAVADETLLNEFQADQPTIAPKHLAIQRLLAEFEALGEMITTSAPRAGEGSEVVRLALSDASLILWQLETEEESLCQQTLTSFQRHLATAQQYRVPLAGYISAPMSRDVVNALRTDATVCPRPEVNCDKFCPKRTQEAPPCAGTEGVTDAELFERLLRPGERSALFASRSQILSRYSPEHKVRFFYLHTGREVARVEIPAWVALDAALLATTHILCYDQAQKGDGYPVALAEAHEQAVVRGVERDAFFRLLERKFIEVGVSVNTTRKAISKRARRV